jgi:hypothetical protein
MILKETQRRTERIWGDRIEVLGVTFFSSAFQD